MVAKMYLYLACFTDKLDTLDENSLNNIDHLKRSVRNLLNRISESNMAKVISELINLFLLYPRALVRTHLTEEVFNLLEVF